MKMIVIIIAMLASLSVSGCTTAGSRNSCSLCILYSPGTIIESSQHESRCMCRLIKDPVAAIRKVLPADWNIDVRHNASLGYNVEERGTAIRLVKNGQKNAKPHNNGAILYIMPPDCANPATEAGRAAFPPVLVAVPSNARIYFRGTTPFTKDLLLNIIKRQ